MKYGLVFFCFDNQNEKKNRSIVFPDFPIPTQLENGQKVFLLSVFSFCLLTHLERSRLQWIFGFGFY